MKNHPFFLLSFCLFFIYFFCCNFITFTLSPTEDLKQFICSFISEFHIEGSCAPLETQSGVHSTHHQLILETNSYVCSNDEAEVSCDDKWQARLVSQLLWTHVQLRTVKGTQFILCCKVTAITPVTFLSLAAKLIRYMKLLLRIVSISKLLHARHCRKHFLSPFKNHILRV
jgi:hypothetical protein